MIHSLRVLRTKREALEFPQLTAVSNPPSSIWTLFYKLPNTHNPSPSEGKGRLQAVNKGDFVTDVNTLPTPASLRPRATCASSGSPLCRKRGSGRERSNERKKSFLALSRFSRSPLLYPCMHHRRQVSSVCGSENICSPCVRSLLRGGRHLHGPSLREPARLLDRFLQLTLIYL